MSLSRDAGFCKQSVNPEKNGKLLWIFAVCMSRDRNTRKETAPWNTTEKKNAAFSKRSALRSPVRTTLSGWFRNASTGPLSQTWAGRHFLIKEQNMVSWSVSAVLMFSWIPGWLVSLGTSPESRGPGLGTTRQICVPGEGLWLPGQVDFQGRTVCKNAQWQITIKN